MKYKSNKMFN